MFRRSTLMTQCLVHARIRAHQPGIGGSDFRKGHDIFLVSTASRRALGLLRFQWVPRALPPRIKQPGRESDDQNLVPRLKAYVVT
jgi:hypothetical protein